MVPPAGSLLLLLTPLPILWEAEALLHSSLPPCVLNCLLLCCRYKLAENIDAQLKRMAQDLKDIIEHLNTSGGPADNSDPVSALVVRGGPFNFVL